MSARRTADQVQRLLHEVDKTWPRGLTVADFRRKQGISENTDYSGPSSATRPMSMTLAAYGYKRIHGRQREQVWRVNQKRARRLWKALGILGGKAFHYRKSHRKMKPSRNFATALRGMKAIVRSSRSA